MVAEIAYNGLYCCLLKGELQSLSSPKDRNSFMQEGR